MIKKREMYRINMPPGNENVLVVTVNRTYWHNVMTANQAQM